MKTEIIDGINYVPLYHFSSVKQDYFTTDPNRFGENYMWTKGDIRQSDLPRTFFYNDKKDIERRYQRRMNDLYHAYVPAKDIYDLYEDPMDYIQKIKQENNGVLNIDALMRRIKDNFYDGVYYKIRGKGTVNYFYKLQVEKYVEE